MVKIESLDFNSLAPWKFEWNLRHVIFKQILVIDGWGVSCQIALIWMSLDFADDQSRLVQVMACCCQATSHYLSQCWPRSLWSYGITRPQWVNTLSSGDRMICWWLLSTLAVEMAFCFTALTPCLEQWWLIVDNSLRKYILSYVKIISSSIKIHIWKFYCQNDNQFTQDQCVSQGDYKH